MCNDKWSRTCEIVAKYVSGLWNENKALKVAEMVYLCTKLLNLTWLRTYVDYLICRDLRAFGGTSLGHKFLVGGPKSIYTAWGSLKFQVTPEKRPLIFLCTARTRVSIINAVHVGPTVSA